MYIVIAVVKNNANDKREVCSSVFRSMLTLGLLPAFPLQRLGIALS